jgi:hypothetical protein
MFAKTLTHLGHTRQFTIRNLSGDGWEVHDEQDSRILRHVRYTDWHRVERALAAFELEVAGLERDGWMQAARNHE